MEKEIKGKVVKVYDRFATYQERQKEYEKLIEYETKNKNQYYLPVGIKYANWKEFRKTCSEEELKKWFNIE